MLNVIEFSRVNLHILVYFFTALIKNQKSFHIFLIPLLSHTNDIGTRSRNSGASSFFSLTYILTTET